MADKIFCGNGKIINTQYGELTKISFSEKDLKTMLANLGANGWINTVLKEKKNKVEGKPTHYLEIDNWQPDGALGRKEKREMNQNVVLDDSDDNSLPF